MPPLATISSMMKTMSPTTCRESCSAKPGTRVLTATKPAALKSTYSPQTYL